MATNSHLSFPTQPFLIAHELEGELIPQRPKDGYINATALCEASRRESNHYMPLAMKTVEGRIKPPIEPVGQSA